MELAFKDLQVKTAGLLLNDSLLTLIFDIFTVFLTQGNRHVAKSGNVLFHLFLDAVWVVPSNVQLSCELGQTGNSSTNIMVNVGMIYVSAC